MSDSSRPSLLTELEGIVARLTAVLAGLRNPRPTLVDGPIYVADFWHAGDFRNHEPHNNYRAVAVSTAAIGLRCNLL